MTRATLLLGLLLGVLIVAPAAAQSPSPNQDIGDATPGDGNVTSGSGSVGAPSTPTPAPTVRSAPRQAPAVVTPSATAPPRRVTPPVLATPRPAAPRPARKRPATSPLRAMLLRLRPCLDKLTRVEWGVLQLRAGSATTRGLDAREVGRRLGLSRANVLKVERRGVRRLKTLGGARGCKKADKRKAAAVTPKPKEQDPENSLAAVPVEQPEPREVALTLPLLLALGSVLWLVGRRRFRRKPSAPSFGS